MSFDACDQLWNADRLGEKWMSLDLQVRSCLSFRDKRCQKDNRCSVQCRIGLNPSGDCAAIGLRHGDIKKDKVGLNALRCLGVKRTKVFLPSEHWRLRGHERGIFGDAVGP